MILPFGCVSSSSVPPDSLQPIHSGSSPDGLAVRRILGGASEGGQRAEGGGSRYEVESRHSLYAESPLGLWLYVDEL